MEALLGPGEALPIPRSWCRWWVDHRELAQRLLLGLGILIVVWDWIEVVLGRSSDLILHWTFGRRFLEGTFLYARGMHIPYPPFWGMAASPLALVSFPVARALVYLVGPLALLLILALLDRLTRDRLPLSREERFVAAALAVILASRFVERDLVECGPNLALVALTWLGVALWIRRREWLGGASLGLAIALKCTPSLFLVYFAWKRQWKIAGITLVAALLFTLAPLVRQGPASYALHMRTWIGNLTRGAREKDPTQGILGNETVQNLSLRPALARLLMRVPPTHKAYVRHPLYVEFLALPAPLAGFIVRACLLLLLGVVAYQIRGPIGDRGELKVLWECAAISVLLLLLSPITWEQHSVGVLPAFYLLMRTAVTRGGLPRWMFRALAVFVVTVLLLNYDVVGRRNSLVLMSYHVITWNLIALLTMALACRAGERRFPLLAPEQGESQILKPDAVAHAGAANG